MKIELDLVLPFIYGTFLGSFLNVCIYRLPRSASILFPPSSCTVCKERIRWWQNIPILSFVMLRAKCESCGSPISFRYPFIELLTGILLAFLWQHDFPNVIQFGCDLFFVALLLVITMIDWDFSVILDSTIWFGLAGGIACALYHRHFWECALAATAGALFFYAVRVLGEFVFLKEAMGEGDVKLAALLGIFLGLQNTGVAIFLSFPIGIVFALILIALRMKNRKDYIPFGPAMALGGFIAAFWGTPLVLWYLHLRG